MHRLCLVLGLERRIWPVDLFQLFHLKWVLMSLKFVEEAVAPHLVLHLSDRHIFRAHFDATRELVRVLEQDFIDTLLFRWRMRK